MTTNLWTALIQLTGYGLPMKYKSIEKFFLGTRERAKRKGQKN